MINREVGRVKFGENEQNRNKLAKGVLFVVTYHLILELLGKILHDIIHLLYINEEVGRNFMQNSEFLAKLLFI